ncbi:hypothetical protein TL16_g12462, partial [Triparma laevis f. inornata]
MSTHPNTPFTALQTKIGSATIQLMLDSPIAQPVSLASALKHQNQLSERTVAAHHPEPAANSSPSVLQLPPPPPSPLIHYSLLEKLNDLKYRLAEDFAKEKKHNGQATPTSNEGGGEKSIEESHNFGGGVAPPPSPEDVTEDLNLDLSMENENPKIEIVEEKENAVVAVPKNKKRTNNKTNKNTPTKKKKQTSEVKKAENELELLAYFDPSNTLLKIVEKQKKTIKKKPAPPRCAAKPKPKTKVKKAKLPSTPKNNATPPPTDFVTIKSPDPKKKSPPPTNMTPYEMQLKGQLTRRNTQIEMLKNQLTAFGDVPIVEVVSLEEANVRLRAALTKLMEGDEKAQDDFDKWDKYIANHPDHIKQKLEEERAWAERNKEPNEEALKIIRTFVPPDIYCSNLKGLKKHFILTRRFAPRQCSSQERMPEKIAERIFARKILWLTRSPPESIAKIHIAELKTKFQAHGLDLVELRAICTILPEAFENDADGAKGEAQRRNAAYGDVPAGPFDPDASPVRQKHAVSTPFTKNNLDDVRRACKEGGNFTENRDTLRKKREEGSVVVPNADRIDVSTIGVVMEDNKDFMSRLESCLGGTPVATPRKGGGQAAGFLDEIGR